jgi:hypothetical protein
MTHEPRCRPGKCDSGRYRHRSRGPTGGSYIGSVHGRAVDRPRFNACPGLEFGAGAAIAIVMAFIARERTDESTHEVPLFDAMFLAFGASVYGERCYGWWAPADPGPGPMSAAMARWCC